MEGKQNRQRWRRQRKVKKKENEQMERKRERKSKKGQEVREMGRERDRERERDVKDIEGEKEGRKSGRQMERKKRRQRERERPHKSSPLDSFLSFSFPHFILCVSFPRPDMNAAFVKSCSKRRWRTHRGTRLSHGESRNPVLQTDRQAGRAHKTGSVSSARPPAG